MKDEHYNPVVLFDGDCIYCNKIVQLISRYDKKDVFHFASLDSGYSKKIFDASVTMPENTMILVEGEKIYLKSTAALRIYKLLGFPFNIIYGLILIPRFLRDFAYRLIANNRQWISSKLSCPLPDERLLKKMITD